MKDYSHWYCNGERWPTYPPTPLPKKGICCHQFAQHYDIYSIYKVYCTTLQQSTLTRTLVELKKLVHHSIVHQLLLKKYHEESLTTSLCRTFPSISQPISLEYKIIKHRNETKYNPNHVEH